MRKTKIASVLKATGRLRCEVPGCNFDFFRVYGKVGNGFAHVHHIESLASKDLAKPTRLKDLVIVCANCHAIIHKGGRCRDYRTIIRK
jgi:predicted HNH restriction endonuclease